jgi:precorrin-6B methylase 1
MRLDAILVVVAALLMSLPKPASAVNGCEEADPGSMPIAPGDILFFGYGNVTQTIVPADGRVIVPLAGEVQVLRQTPNHLAQLVRERLSRYINKSAVEIYVEDDGEQHHCFREPDTVVDALDYLGVIRKLENDYKARFPWGQILRFNYKESRKADNGDQIIIIETGDPIYRPLYLRKRLRLSFTID